MPMQEQNYTPAFHAFTCAASFAAYSLVYLYTHDASLATALAF